MALSLLEMKAQFADPMRQGIVDLLWQNGRVMRFLNFIQNAGLAYSYAGRAKLPGVGFRNLNEDFTPTSGVTNPLVEQLSILGGEIKTDSVQIAVKGQQARTFQIANQIEAVAKCFDKNFFNGDPSTANGKGFYGLKKRLAGTQLVTNSANGATIDGNQVRVLLARVNGPNSEKVLFMNQTDRLNLETWASDSTALNRAQYLSYQMVADNTGKQVRTLFFDGARVEEVYYDETETAILGYTETCGTGVGVCASVYCVRFGGSSDERDVQGLSGLPGDIQSYGPVWTGALCLDVQQMLSGIGIFGGFSAARLQGTKAS